MLAMNRAEMNATPQKDSGQPGERVLAFAQDIAKHHARGPCSVCDRGRRHSDLVPVRRSSVTDTNIVLTTADVH
jgi:hypothetical protein